MSLMSMFFQTIKTTIKTYPIEMVGISGFAAFYMFRSLKTYYTPQRKITKTNQTNLFIRVTNSCLCIGAIIGVSSMPILYSANPKMKLSHAFMLGISQIPYWWFTDFFTSPTNAAYHNYKSMIANKFSNLKILIYNIINANIIYLIPYTVIHYFGLTEYKNIKQTYEWNYSSIFKLFTKIGINVVLADVFVYNVHRWMHLTKNYTDIHLMHHACFTSAITTSLCFNPIDLCLEFGASFPPILISYFINKDKLAFIYSLSVLLGWYHTDHDENMRTFHYKHHSVVSKDRTAYVPYKEKNTQGQIDQIRERLAKGYGYQKSK